VFKVEQTDGKEIASVEGDKTVTSNDKKDQLEQLRAELKSTPEQEPIAGLGGSLDRALR
jgi:hypothetical protein